MNNNLILSVNKISKSFTRLAGAKITVIDNINLRIEKNGKSGQFISVLASFGSGKSRRRNAFGESALVSPRVCPAERGN